jgi:hypothetical protein
MRFPLALFFLVCAGLSGAQTAEDGDVVRARLELLRIEGLVSSGAMPEAQIQKAQAAVEDAEDVALLRKNLYQQDLTEEQSGADQQEFRRTGLPEGSSNLPHPQADYSPLPSPRIRGPFTGMFDFQSTRPASASHSR